MYTKYFGTVHQTGEIQEFPLSFPIDAKELILILSALNRESHVYGITYWVAK